MCPLLYSCIYLKTPEESTHFTFFSTKRVRETWGPRDNEARQLVMHKHAYLQIPDSGEWRLYNPDDVLQYIV